MKWWQSWFSKTKEDWQHPISDFSGDCRQLACMKKLLAEVIGGNGQIWLVYGEQGAGKSFLIQKFINQSRKQYPQLFITKGGANKVGESRSLFPIFQSLQWILHSKDPWTTKLADIVRTELRYLPNFQLTKSFAHKILEGKFSPTDIIPRVPYLRFAYYAICEAYQAIHECGHPLLIVLENMQQCDPETAEFLQLLFAIIRKSSILLIVVYSEPRQENIHLNATIDAACATRVVHRFCISPFANYACEHRQHHSPTKEDFAKQCYQAAYEQYLQQAYIRALKICHLGMQATDNQELQFDFLVLLGDIHLDNSNFVQAQIHYQQAQNLKIKIPQICFSMGRAQRLLGQLPQAEKSLLRGTEHCVAGSNYQWHIALLLELNTIYYQQQKMPQAREALHKAHSIAQSQRHLELEAITAIALGKFYCQQLAWQKALNCYYQSYHLYSELRDPLRQGAVLTEVANIHYQQEQWQQCLCIYQQALALFQQAHYLPGTAHVDLQMATVMVEQGNYSTALEIVTRNIDYYRNWGYEIGIATGRRLQGDAFSKLKEYRQALVAYDKAKRIYYQKHIDDYQKCCERIARINGKRGNRGTAMSKCLQLSSKPLNITNHPPKLCRNALNNIARLHLIQGKWNDALSRLQQSLKIQKSAGIYGGRAITLLLIGKVYQAQQFFAQAHEQYQASYTINQHTQNIRGQVIVLQQIAMLCIEQRQYQNARQYLQRALAVYEQTPSCLAVKIDDTFAELYCAQGKHTKALTKLRRSLATKEIWRELYSLGNTLHAFGHVYHAQYRWNKAQHYYERALAMRILDGDLHSEACVLTDIGQLFLDQDQLLTAMEYFSKCLQIRQKIADVANLATTYCKIADTYLQMNRWDKALQNYQRALTHCNKNNQKLVATLCKKLAELCMLEKREPEALRYYRQILPYYKNRNVFLFREIEAKIEELGN